MKHDCDRCGKSSRVVVDHPFLKEGSTPFRYCRPCMRAAARARRAMNHRPARADELVLTRRLELAAEGRAFDPRQLEMAGT